MDGTWTPVAGVLMRWAHITSVAILTGGLFYALFVARELNARFRPWIYATSAILVGSGLYNLLTKASLPRGYHAWFGIKMLFVAHILVVSLLLTTKVLEKGKQARMLKSVVFSALGVLLISAYLRWLSLA